jgi:hypothetical protein
MCSAPPLPSVCSQPFQLATENELLKRQVPRASPTSRHLLFVPTSLCADSGDGQSPSPIRKISRLILICAHESLGITSRVSILLYASAGISLHIQLIPLCDGRGEVFCSNWSCLPAFKQFETTTLWKVLGRKFI